NLTTAPFVKIANGYYYFDLGEKKNWFEAYQACRRMDAELLTFETLEEWQTISEYVFEQNIKRLYWTSGTDQGREGVYTWFSNGQALIGGMWGNAQPDNAGNTENCIEYGWIMGKSGIGLNDRPCGNNYQTNFICEAAKPKTASFVIW
ncbi:lectin-37Da, partial [Drosophila busckii]